MQNKLSVTQQKSLEVAQMSVADLPKSFPENHANLWRAFYCGVDYKSAQQSVHLTALRRGLAASILFNLVLLIVFAVIIGGR